MVAETENKKITMRHHSVDFCAATKAASRPLLENSLQDFLRAFAAKAH